MQRRQLLTASIAGLAASAAVITPTGDRDSGPGPILLRGRWPAELRRRFYRNGPALMERGAVRYHH